MIASAGVCDATDHDRLGRTAARSSILEGHGLGAVLVARDGRYTDPFVPNVVWAGGYGGQGIAQGFTLGRRAAERIIQVTS